MTALTTRELGAYGVLGFPLAMAALPIYVHVPKFYGDILAVPLATVGGVLLAVRAWDALQDPLLGWWSDRRREKAQGRWAFVLAGAPLLGLGVVALFSPPAALAWPLVAWMATSLLLVYTAFSLVSVSYQAIGAELAREPTERTRVTAWREGFGLAGVLVAAVLPELLRETAGDRGAYAAAAWCFLPVLAASVAVSRLGSPSVPARMSAPGGSLTIPWRNRRFRALAVVFIANGIAAAIPATLVLFYVDDVLHTPRWAGAFLVAYFAAGALGMPAWVALSKRRGKATAWKVSMILAIAAFAGAFVLGPGDIVAFFAICVLSGLALGADLALPASMLADAIDEDESRGLGRHEGTYFGLWNLLAKANLAIAAGLALPLVAALGYVPRTTTPESVRALALAYALLPCALKLVAVALLDRAFQPVEKP